MTSAAQGSSPRRRRVTQRDVASRLGVSSASVSYAFNGSSGVSESMRDRILAVAAEMGYRPNRSAQGLRRGRSNMIGLLLADIGNPFYPEVASGVVKAATEVGFHVLLAEVGRGGSLQSQAARDLVDRDCDGLLFTSVVPDDADLLRELQAQGVPFVCVNRRIEQIESDWVGIDDHAASSEATQWLVRTGARRIAVIGGPQLSSVSRARSAGAEAAIRSSGAEHVAPLLRDGELSRSSGVERTRLLLDSGVAVDAIVCGNDMIALGVLDVCQERRVRIPEDIAVVGFDDMSFASAGPLQLTTVSLPRQVMGSRAVELLDERIKGYDGAPREVLLPHNLTIRATTHRAPD